MNLLLSAITTALVPLIPLTLPGILQLVRPRPESFFITIAKVIAISLTTHIITLFLAALLGLPGISIFFVLVGITFAFIIRWRQYSTSPIFVWKLLTFIAPLLFIYTLFSAPYLLNQDGLPTGDIQKSIFWAQEISATNRLPDYSRALTQLNRDPVDFYTPGLHALTAYLLSLSPEPLITIGLFSITLATAAAWLTISYIKLLFPQAKFFIYILAPLFLLTNIRFLRYVREPGYHFQNLAGELLLFLFLFFSLLALKDPKQNRLSLSLMITTFASLLITHQFSTFIAAFIALPLILTALYHYRTSILMSFHRPLFPLFGSITVLLALTVAFNLGLHQKIPHLFTTTPHLLPLTPSLADYPVLLGTLWSFLSFLGLLLFLHKTLQHRQPIHVACSGILLVLLLLSQGPRFGIDIPPVRALFYIVLPGSLLAAFASGQLWRVLGRQSASSRLALRAFLLITIITATYTSLTTAYASSNPLIRTNSTLTAPENLLITQLAATNPTQAVLVDDYNQRSASWLLLSQKPTFSRLASDLERLMEEAAQSPERYQLYLNHLDYEKIFSLASRPEAIHLLSKHAISHVTGIQKTTKDGFSHNPALMPSAEGDQIQLFTINPAYQLSDCPPNSLCHFLLKASTLVNDFGDSEDTFAHLPASLRSTRLSEPQHQDSITYRTSSAPHIPLVFNIGDYVKALWDQDNNHQVDTNLEFILLFSQTPSAPLHIMTATGQTYPLNPRQPIRIPAREVLITPDGFITLTLENPQQELLHLDLTALGLSPVP